MFWSASASRVAAFRFSSNTRFLSDHYKTYYLKAIELDPREHLSWFKAASALAYLGDEEGYRKLTADALARFRGTEEAMIAERIAKACLLLPPVADLPALAEMADRAVTAGQQAGSIDLGWFRMCKALAEYRAGEGHYADALTLLEQARGSINDANGQLTADVLRAMALHKLGRTAEARKAFDQATRDAVKVLPVPRREALSEGNFQEWCISHVVMREARVLFEPAPGAGEARQ